jgi:hypothetical protein
MVLEAIPALERFTREPQPSVLYSRLVVMGPTKLLFYFKGIALLCTLCLPVRPGLKFLGSSSVVKQWHLASLFIWNLNS